jgi:hypothetical protein
MTLFILDENPAKTAEYLANKDLSKQIAAIAQILCNIHHHFYANYYGDDKTERWRAVPLSYKDISEEWLDWGRACQANYRYLVGLGMACCEEHTYRYSEGYLQNGVWYCNGKVKYHKHDDVIRWASWYEPDLPVGRITTKEKYADVVSINIATPIPLIIPAKYKFVGSVLNNDWYIVDSYRRYYQAKIGQIKKVKCKQCNGFGDLNPGGCSDTDCCTSYPCDCDNGYVTKQANVVWTRRDKPEWLNLQLSK